jgi:hypothetical protein
VERRITEKCRIWTQVWIDRKRKVIRQEEKNIREKPIRNEGPVVIESRK